MTNNSIPMAFPLPRNHPGNAIHSRHSVDSILERLRNRNASSSNIDENGYAILHTAKAMYNRLFKKRSKDKRKLRLKKGVVYGLIRPDGQTLAVFRTKAEAVTALRKDSVTAKMFGKPMSQLILERNSLKKTNEMPIGTMLLKVPTKGSVMSIDTDRYEYDNRVIHLVDSKKCSSCPNAGNNKKSNRTIQCHCSLIGFIRDSTPGWTYWSQHQVKMHVKKQSKQQRQIIRIRASDLFD